MIHCPARTCEFIEAHKAVAVPIDVGEELVQVGIAQLALREVYVAPHRGAELLKS